MPSRRWCPTPIGSGSCSALAERRSRGHRRADRGLRRVVAARRGHADVVLRRELRLGAVRARAVGRAHPRGRRRAHQRRPARTDRDVAGDGRRCVAAQPRPPAAARSAGIEADPRAGATSPRPSRRTPRISSASATSIRPGSSPTRSCARAQREPARTAHATRRARALRPRHHDEARAVAPARLRRRVVRAVQGAVPCDRPAGDSGRSPSCCRRNRTPARGAACATSCVGFGAQGPRVGAAADERAELGGAAHRGVPAARVRRLRGAARS